MPTLKIMKGNSPLRNSKVTISPNGGGTKTYFTDKWGQLSFSISNPFCKIYVGRLIFQGDIRKVTDLSV